MKVRAVVLDRDGTLVDSWPPAYEVMKRISEELGMPIEESSERDMFIRKNWGEPGAKMVPNLFPGIDPDEFFKKWHEIQSQIIKDRPPLFPGTTELMKELWKRGIGLGLLTSRTEESLAREILEEENRLYQKYFSFVQTYDSGGIKHFGSFLQVSTRLHPNHISWHHHKPNSEVFERILSWFTQRNVSPKEILYVGDSPVDFRAAEGSGIPFVGVLTGPMNTRARWQVWAGLNPKNVIENITELSKWLEENS